MRRNYGEFSGNRLASWDKAIQSLAILRHRQRGNSTGKNASDTALAIDAIDPVNKGTLDGFCPVGSDSDFTRFAQRHGFGARKTVEAFGNACNRFIYVENLARGAIWSSKADHDGGRQGREIR